MIGTEFNKLAELVEGDLKKYDDKYHVGDSSFLHTATYILTYEYQNCHVTIKNSFGQDNIGNIEILLPIQSNNFKFEIKTKSILSQLWNRKKSPLEVFSSNTALVKWIEENKAFEKLCERAKLDRFEPTIIGVKTTEGFSINCAYHLVFNNYELTLAPFSSFFNGLIDFIQDAK
ncbi:MAG: hypothetical protein ACI8ZM_001608 [Crocinitomix sp.]|jgi:hypothetical protein